MGQNWLDASGNKSSCTLISDAHEWINEIPTVPNYYLAKTQPRERTWFLTAGKEDPFELDSMKLGS